MRPCATIVDTLKRINAEAIDVALVDVNLNGMRSHAVMQALHAKHIPFCVGDCLPDRREPRRRDCDPGKPYTPENLRAAIEQAIA